MTNTRSTGENRKKNKATNTLDPKHTAGTVQKTKSEHQEHIEYNRQMSENENKRKN
jgi:hypothetical protein